MSKNPSFRQPSSLLSVGDVVSAALRIYRDHFKVYWRLAFTAYLWLLVPIYGWAKYSAISGLLSRLAFSELIERPEPVSEARRPVNARMWSFWLAGILVSLILIGLVVGGFIVFGILIGIIAAVSGQNTGLAVALAVLTVVAAIAFFIGYIRLLSRLFIVEVPLAIENNLDASSAISRSWKLTKGYVSRIQWIVLVAVLVTLPISIVVQIISSLIQAFLTTLFPPDSSAFVSLYLLLVIAVSFVSGSLLVPFWQAIKAVIYYDVRNRKEGLDLKMRDSRPQ